MAFPTSFFNDGTGWQCIQCVREYEQSLPEGDAENRSATREKRGIAKWADPARRTLTCPDCGITELIDII
jgi:rubredoxin